MFSLSRTQLSNKEIKEIISSSEWKWPTKEQLTLSLRMWVRCEREGANAPQFWIEQFCVVTHYPPRFFSRCKSTHFEALWIPPREQHSWVRGVGVRLSSGFEALDYAAKKTDANKRLLFDKVPFVDSLRRLRWDNVLVSTETSVRLIPFSNFKFWFKREYESML
jgi:hypothetical protein